MLRDQALSFCRLVSPEARESFGATSLVTIVQMVAHGYGITLLPEMSVASEVPSAQRYPSAALSCVLSQNAKSSSPGARPRRATSDFHAFAALLKDVARRRH